MELLIYFVLGLGSLLVGRKLFWLYVAAAGFLFGLHIADAYFSHYDNSAVILMGVIIGLITGILAIFLYKAEVILAGFFAGGLLAVEFLSMATTQATQFFDWMVFGFGGILGGVLAYFFLEWTLIILSSFIGAILLSKAFIQSPSQMMILVIAIFGAIIQGALYLKSSNES